MGIADTRSANRNNRTICFPFSQDNYESNIHNPDDFRGSIDKRIELFPELFPPEIENGYQMKDFYFSKKQSIWSRRIKTAGVAYTVSAFIHNAISCWICGRNRKGSVFEKVRCAILGYQSCFWQRSHVLASNRTIDRTKQHCRNNGQKSR